MNPIKAMMIPIVSIKGMTSRRGSSVPTDNVVKTTTIVAIKGPKIRPVLLPLLNVIPKFLPVYSMSIPMISTTNAQTVNQYQHE